MRKSLRIFFGAVLLLCGLFWGAIVYMVFFAEWN